MSDSPTPGRVTLVGAGPGEPDYITVRGRRRLQQADVVVYDALADPRLLDEAPPQAERIDAGKRARQHRLTQDQTNELLLARAQAGLHVVRLKGGDPYLFGRGAEEAAFVAQHGIPVEVVPGITSGIAAPMTAGCPVTHRTHASTVTFVTGHEDPTKAETSVDYPALAALAQAGGTLCFYMGMGRLNAIAEKLTHHGLDPRTPLLAVQWGASPRQRQIRSTLQAAANDCEQAGLGPPAILVVGAVAGLHEPGLNFYTNRPLFGQRILVTRTRPQASDLRQRLAEHGADVMEAPTIELADPPSWDPVDEALKSIAEVDWLVLTSANGVKAVADRWDVLGLDARSLAGVNLAAIGDATAAAMRAQLGVRPDLVPTRYVAESLAAELIAQHDIAGKRVLLLRADIARPALPQKLTEAGAHVRELTAYETRRAESLPEHVLQALRDHALDWVTFTSSSTARNLVELLGPERDLLRHARLASIGPITSDTLRQLGYEPTLEAATSNISGLVQALTIDQCPAAP